MKPRYLFLSFVIPDEEMKNMFEIDMLPSIQTHKFNWNLLKGIEAFNKIDIVYVSAKAISDYPFCKKRVIFGKRWPVYIYGKKIELNEIPFLNFGLLKIITRTIFGFYFCVKEFGFKSNKQGIIVYSVHVPFMLIGYILSKLYKIDCIAIWTDPPSVSNTRDSFLKTTFRNIENIISRFLMKKMSKVIAITKYLAEDFAPKIPYIVIEGIVDEETIKNNKLGEVSNDSAFLKVVYTGSISKRYGIENIVKAFELIENKSIVLQIYGRGDFEEELVDICKNNSNTEYKGFLPNEIILEIQKEANFLINARSSEDLYVNYSFPSKTLEYMLSGTPIISTMLPGIPDEYRDYLIVLSDNKPETIKKKLEELEKLSLEQRNDIGLKALRFAEGKSYLVQGRKIVDFIIKKQEEVE